MAATAPPLEARPRLEDRLRRALGGRLSVIVAAPGYGKTTALARAARLDRRPSIWCALTGGAAGQQQPSWAGVRVAIEGSRGPHLLLVDDVDRLGPSDRDGLIAFVVSELPRGWHAMAASGREPSSGEMARALCAGDADRLDESDLAFDLDQTRRSLEAGPVGLDPEVVFEQTLGWPLGVVAFAHGRAEALTGFFQTAIVGSATPRMAAFLRATAVLESLTPEACRALTRMADAPRLLDELADSHRFVLRRSGDLIYHPLLRATLLESARRTNPRLLVRLYERSTDYYLRRAEFARAIRAAGAGNDWARATRILCSAAPGLVAAWRSTELVEWTNAFPAELREGDPWVLHYRAVGLRAASSTDDAYQTARGLQQRARDGFAARHDHVGETHAVAELGILAWLLGRPAEAENLLDQARARLAETPPFMHTAVLTSLADVYVARNRLGEAIRAGAEAVSLPEDALTPSEMRWRVRALARMGMAHLRKGEPAQGLEVGRRALELAREHRLDARTTALATFAVGVAHWNWGDLDAALQNLTDAESLALDDQSQEVLASIVSARVEVLACLDRLDEAEQVARRRQRSGHTVHSLGVLRFLQSRFFEARVIFEQQLSEAIRVGSEGEVARAKAWLGATALQAGRLVEAERWLLEAAHTFEWTESRHRLIGTSLHLAQLHFRRGASGSAKGQLRRALGLAAAAGYFNFFLWHAPTFASLAARALTDGIQPDYVEALSARRLPTAQSGPFLPLLSAHDPTVRDRARRVVDRVLGRDGMDSALAELRECHDHALVARLRRSLAERRLTPGGLLLLRRRYGLTWAETDVFAEYYLTPSNGLDDGVERGRREVARRLGLSENTLMHHVSSMRRRVGFDARKGSAAVLLWSVRAGIVDAARLAATPGRA